MTLVPSGRSLVDSSSLDDCPADPDPGTPGDLTGLDPVTPGDLTARDVGSRCMPHQRGVLLSVRKVGTSAIRMDTCQ